MSLNACLPEPWHSFLAEIDAALAKPVSINCIGGFALTVHYGMSRPTADVDVLEVSPEVFAGPLIVLGCEGGPLHRKYKLYIDPVTIAFFPENYAGRLSEIFPEFTRIFAFGYWTRTMSLSRSLGGTTRETETMYDFSPEPSPSTQGL
jgi:hypothetical protein